MARPILQTMVFKIQTEGDETILAPIGWNRPKPEPFDSRQEAKRFVMLLRGAGCSERLVMLP